MLQVTKRIRTEAHEGHEEEEKPGRNISRGKLVPDDAIFFLKDKRKSRKRMNGQLIVFAGLPGTGKTTLARKLAKALPAFLIRIDTIEQALISNGDPATKVGPMGYVIAYRLASENLRLGASVVADCVNPVYTTREAWREVAKSERAPIFEIEVICSNRLEHRERVETRTADIKGLRLPTWEEAVRREYEPWNEEILVIDTAKVSSDEAIGKIVRSLHVS